MGKVRGQPLLLGNASRLFFSHSFNLLLPAAVDIVIYDTSFFCFTYYTFFYRIFAVKKSI